MNFYKRHLGDIAKATSHLSQGQMGAYDLLLDWHYSNEKPLPLCATDLHRIARAASKTERANVDRVVAEFFTRTQEGYVQKRAVEEIEKAQGRAAKNREIGKLGGRPKEPKAEPNGNPNGFDSETQTLTESVSENNPSQNPESRIQEHESPIGDSSPSAGADGPPTRLDPIPYQAIVDVFNRTLTRLPKARSLTPKRRTLIRSAWQAAPERRSVEFWEALAAEYEADDFTNGTGPYLNGHEGWRPTIDYLLRADVVTRTFERAMDRMERAA